MQPRTSAHGSPRTALWAAFACWMALSALPAAAQPDLDAGERTGAPGETVEVPVSLAARASAAAVQLDLLYDEAVLQPQVATGGDALADHVVDSAVVAPGRLRVTVTTATPSQLASGDLFLVPFVIDADAPAGVQPITIEGAVIADVTGVGIDPLSVDPGSITVAISADVLEIPTVGTLGLIALAALLLLAGLGVARGPGGGRALMAGLLIALLLAGATRPLHAAAFAPGDANGDGLVDADDIPVIVDQILERSTSPGNPDCNSDTVIDVRDTICSASDPLNRPPTLAAIADRSVIERQVVALSATATDPDLPGDLLTWTLPVKPVGATVDPTSGALLWVPRADQLGAHPFTVRVTDQAGAFDEKSFLVTVGGVGGPPVLAPIADRATTVGSEVAAAAVATDPDLPDDTLVYSLPLAPAGATIDPSTGAIAWTPTSGQLGVHDLTVQVTDSQGLLDFTGFVVTVGDVNGPPVAADDVYVARTGETLVVGAAGVLENDSDPDGDPLTAELVSGPTNGALDLAPDGSFSYAPAGPGSVQSGIDLTRFSSIGVEASGSFSASYLPERVADGYLETSWFSELSPASPFVGVLFAEPGVLVREVRIFGNRQFPDTKDFFTGFVSLLDDAGAELWNSGPLALPAPDRDLVVDIDPPVAAVYEARFTGTDWQNAPSNDPGISELQVMGDGPVLNLSPDVEWAWTAATIGSANVNDGDVLMSPTVGDLDGDGVPEVLMIGVAGHELYVLDGRDGSVLWSAPDIYYRSSSPVVGDLDETGGLEVATVRDDASTLAVFDHDGTLIDEISTGRTVGEGNLALADLDGDGLAEIVVPGSGRIQAYHLVAGELVQLWESANDGCGNNAYRSNCIPVVADVDLDGEPEIVGGRVIYGADGSTEVENTDLPNGWNAIGNFDDDPFAEIVLVRSGDAWLLEHDLTVKWGPIDLPGGGAGGPPTVADFDGDGVPEIGVAGSNRYGVLDTDGTVLWEAVTVDGSSNRTGSTVFDFQNDGSAEVVYRDERNLWIFRGSDGEVLFSTPMGSATTVEYPIVADVDADGEAEIVVPSDVSRPLPDGSQRVPGLYVFGSGAGSWVRTRPIWNQHTYHVTNVLADGTIPAVEQPSWLLPGLNHYRQNDFLPDEPGRADTFTYRALDGAFASNTATVYLDVRPSNTAPRILSSPDRTATAGFVYLHAVRAVDLESDPLVFSLTSGPAGMTIDPATGLLRWTPGDSDVGTHPVAVKVTDDDGFFGQQGFELVVVAPIEVPDVVGLDDTSAESSLTGAGLVKGTVSERFDLFVAAGLVAAQDPPAGAAAEPGAAVSLALSLGPAPEDVDDDGDGFSDNEGDCNDDANDIFPGATDIPGDGIDQDCDGSDATLPLESVVVEPDDPTLLVGETLSLRAFGIHDDGTARNVTATATWTSANTAAVQVVAGRIFAVGAGVADVGAEIEGKSDAVTVTVVAADPTDEEPAVVEITSPADGETVFGPIDIVGTANDPNLVRYELLISPADEQSFTLIGGGTAPVVGGVLGRLDPTLMLNDLYTLRLVAVDAGGNRIFDEVTVQVDGEQKVGNFTLSFVDLQVPVAGIPITVIRTYDSREKRRRDFGVGWNLSIQTIEISCTNPLGEGWYVARSGLAYGLLPTRIHRCSLRIPGRRAEEFDFVPSTTVSPIVPFSFLSGRFAARPGTTGKLQVLGGAFLAIVDPQPGEVTLRNDGNLSLFAPTSFRYTALDGTRIDLTDSRVERIEDANGNRLVFSPGGISHSSGKSIGLVRDAVGRIVEVVDPSGNRQSYRYSAAGDLVSHEDREGNTVRFGYDQRHNLLTVIGGNGSPITRNEYDDEGRLIKSVDPQGNETLYDVDLGARQQVVTDRNGESTVFLFDEQGNVLQQTDAEGNLWQYTYDDRGNQLTRTDPEGNVRTSTYDGDGNPTSWTDPLGHRTEIQYDAAGRVLSRTDASGRTVQFEYDSRGNQVAVIDANGDTLRGSYDSSGNLLQQIDARGFTKTLSYGAGGFLTGVTDALGHPTSIERDPNGNATAFEYTRQGPSGPETVRWVHDWDRNDRLVGSTAPGLGSSTTVYDGNGQAIGGSLPSGADWSAARNIRGEVESMVSASGTAMSAIYDAEGRMVNADVDGTGEIARQFDALGNVRSIDLPDTQPTTVERDPRSLITRRTSPAGSSVEYEFDAAERETLVSWPDGSFVTRAFDDAGRHVRTTNQDGASITYDYDDVGRLFRITDPTGVVREATYDAAGNLETRVQPGGGLWEYEYDGAGRVIEAQNAVGDRWSYSFTEDGHPLTIVTPRNDTYAFEFDALGRLTGYRFPEGEAKRFELDSYGRAVRVTRADGIEIEFSRDDLARTSTRSAQGRQEISSFDPMGRLVRHESPDGTVELAWDGMGRLTGWTGTDGTSVVYGRDGSGRVSTIETSEGVTGIGYDTRDRVASLTHAGQVTQIARNFLNLPATVTFPGGVVAAFDYDAVGRARSISYEMGGASLFDLSYSYDGGGRIQEITETGGPAVTYVYDAAGRLTSEQSVGGPSGQILYQLDGSGNLAQVDADGGSRVFSYDGNERLLEAGSTDYGWDENGNLVERTEGGVVERFAYDDEDRLVRYERGGPDAVTVEYEYDPDGLLHARSENGVVVFYSWDRGAAFHPMLLEERSADGGLLRRYFHDGIFHTHFVDGTGDATLLARDHLGSVRLWLDEAGSVLHRFDYDAYGNLVGSPSDEVAVGFAGGLRDPQTGFVFFRSRWYSPEMRRFVQVDSADPDLLEPDGLNRYLYASADPVNRIDLDGQGDTNIAAVITTLAVITFVIMAAHIVYLGGPKRLVASGLGWLAAVRSPATLDAKFGLLGVAGFSLTGNYGIGGSAGYERLLFNKLKKSGVYLYFGPTIGLSIPVGKGGKYGAGFSIGGFGPFGASAIYNTPTPESYSGYFLATSGSLGSGFARLARGRIPLGGGISAFWSPLPTYRVDPRRGEFPSESCGSSCEERYSHGWRAGASIGPKTLGVSLAVQLYVHILTYDWDQGWEFGSGVSF